MTDHYWRCRPENKEEAEKWPITGASKKEFIGILPQLGGKMSITELLEAAKLDLVRFGPERPALLQVIAAMELLVKRLDDLEAHFELPSKWDQMGQSDG